MSTLTTSVTHQKVRAFTGLLVAGLSLTLLAGCAVEPADPEPESTPAEAEPAEILSVAVEFDSPGLVHGVHAESLDGLEVQLASTLAQQMIGDPFELAFVPFPGNAAASSLLSSGTADLVLGSFPLSSFEQSESQDPLVAGPFLMAQPAVLLPISGTDEALEGDNSLAPSDTSVDSIADLPGSQVCVVQNTIPSQVSLPAASVLVQDSYRECAVGLRSGRADAVFGDEVALSGIQADPEFQNEVRVVTLTDFMDVSASTARPEGPTADPSGVLVPARLHEPVGYGILISGNSPYCAAINEAIQNMLSRGVVNAAWGASAFPESLTPQIPSAADFRPAPCAVPEFPDDTGLDN